MWTIALDTGSLSSEFQITTEHLVDTESPNDMNWVEVCYRANRPRIMRTSARRNSPQPPSAIEVPWSVPWLIRYRAEPMIAPADSMSCRMDNQLSEIEGHIDARIRQPCALVVVGRYYHRRCTFAAFPLLAKLIRCYRNRGERRRRFRLEENQSLSRAQPESNRAATHRSPTSVIESNRAFSFSTGTHWHVTGHNRNLTFEIDAPLVAGKLDVVTRADKACLNRLLDTLMDRPRLSGIFSTTCFLRTNSTWFTYALPSSAHWYARAGRGDLTILVQTSPPVVTSVV